MISHRLLRIVRVVVFWSLVIGHWSFAWAQDPPPDVRFGVVEALWDANAAAEAGVGWERILFYWATFQPNGPQEWVDDEAHNRWVATAQASGRQVVGLLKNTPAWATDGPPYAGVPRGLDLPPDDPNNVWAGFVRRIVSTYAGRVDHWIIWNEPEIDPGVYGYEWAGTVEDYYRLLQVAYLAAKEANPNAVIHLAGLTYWHDVNVGRPYFLRRLLAVAAQDPTAPGHGYYFDVASVHIYFRTETVPEIISQTRAALAAYGLDKPIWVNETNASPDSDPEWPVTRPEWRVSLEEQAGFLLQAFALGLASGAQRIAVHKFSDAGLSPGDEPFGLLRPDGSRRPAYDAYRLITTHYAGTQTAQANRQPRFYQVTLERGGLTTHVLWARTQADVTVTLSARSGEAQWIDQAGAAQTLDGTGGQYTLRLPGARCADARGCIIGGPTYLLVEESSAGGGEAGVSATPTSPSPSPLPPPSATATPSPAPVPASALTTVPALTATAVITPTPVPTSTPTPTATPSSTSTRSLPSATPSPTGTPTAAPTPTSTGTPLPTDTSTPGSTSTPESAPVPAAQRVGLVGAVLLLIVLALVLRARGRT